jgi:polyhydroxyalkanoate synthesis regulator phasin
MAKAKKSTKKAVKKTKSQFYVVRTAREAGDNLTDMVKDYNEKYLKKPFKTGKEFIEDLRMDPRKVFDGLVDDGQDFVKGVRKDARKTVDDGKKLVKDLRKDPRKVIDDFLDSGKKAFKKFPMVETVEKKVNSGLKAVPSQLNLPGKKDIEKLTSSVKALNNKVEHLSKQYAA